MSELCSTLLWCALQTTLLAMLTLILGSRPWRIGGALAPFFGLVGVLFITGLAFFPIPWSWDFRVLDRQSASLAPSSPTASPVANMENAAPLLENQSPMSFEAGATFLEGFFEKLRYSAEPSHSNSSLSPVSTIVLALFAIGITIGALRFVIGLVMTRRLVRASVSIQEQRLEEVAIVLRAKLCLKRPVEIYQTDRLSTAATLGVWRPLILLPSHWRNWSDAELNAVLAHELAHIAHGDFAAVLISQLSIVIHFYHPLVHWLSSRLRLEQELAADSVAAQFAGGQVRYLRVLAKLALEHQDQFVGWPARAFLPTRHTFLRRLEMLRNVRLISSGRVSVGRWIAMTTIGLVAVVLVGMKPPPNPAMAQDAVANVVGKGTASSVQYDLRYFSDEGGIVIAAKPAELLEANSLTGVGKQMQELPQVTQLLAPFGVELKDIEQVLVAMASPGSMPTSIYVRSSKPMGELKALPGGKPSKVAGIDVLSVASGETCIWKPDDRSVVVSSIRNVERWMQGRAVERKLTETELWKTLKDRPLLVMSEGRVTRNWLRGAQPGNGPGITAISSFSPILDEAEVLGAAVSLDSEWSLMALAKSSDAKGAATIQETSQAGVVLIKNALREIERTFKSQPETLLPPTDTANAKNALEVLLSAGIKLADNAKVQIEGTIVSVKTNIKSEDIPVASLATAIMQTRQAAERSQSANNLKQIALAFHNFESTYRQFPGTSRSPNPGHKHPVSWRVMILPFIEQNELYSAYRFDEPWDGPNNSKLLARIPKIYRHPDAATDSTESNYAILVGEETIFPPTKAPKIFEITDGTSDTIMLIETKKSIPWTKPEDIEYEKDKPIPLMGGFSESGFNAAFADGSVRFLAKTLNESLLRSMITARGGEVISNP
jgi:beta-lactamase regulating signal transducer with metallopeptidase domain